MNEKKDFDWWCGRAWIKFSCLLSALMVFLVLLNWRDWPDARKLLAAVGALIPVHVLEEWVFPGGFHYQYNCLMRSRVPDRYPMCRASDMFTNLSVTVFYMVLSFLPQCPGVLLGTMVFCFLETVMHTVFGILMFLKFRSRGKTTVYGPGSITAYWGFTVLGVLFCYELEGARLVFTDWLACAGVLLFILVIGILIPENILKAEDSKYFFKSQGYYERFL